MWNDWAVPKLPEEDRRRWLQDTLVASIAQVVFKNDRVDEVVIIPDLYDDVTAVLADAKLPATFPPQEGIPKEQIEREFAAYCKGIVVRTATIEQLSTAEAMNIPPESIFIRLITANMKMVAFLDEWDKSNGLTASLLSMGSTILPSANERRLLFLFSHLMDLKENNKKKIQMATSIPNF